MPNFSTHPSALYADPDWASARVFGRALLRLNAGYARTTTIAAPAIAASHLRLTTNRPQRSQARLYVKEERWRRCLSNVGPHVASMSGSSVVATAMATSGLSI